MSQKLIPDLSRMTLVGVILLFLILGPLCIYRAYLIYGAVFVQSSFSNILQDPIYQYAVADLGAIFTIFSYWIYKECKVSGKSFWYWPVLLFVVGTPGLAIYLFFRHKKETG